MSGYANEQKHYVAFTPIQVMQQLMNTDEFQGFCKGNTIKYILRANYKGQYHSDIQKAKQYMWWSEVAKTGKLIDPATDIPPEDWEPSIL